jgi:iron complex outermembrane receptor protein
MSADGGEASTIGFYLDEIPITPPTLATNGKVAIDPDLYDLTRVEVLRGPQGTLYGAGSMGGTVKLVTTPPDPKAFYGSSDTIVSGTDRGGVNYGQKAMLNLPLIEDLAALRLVGTYTHTSGWIDRIVVPHFPLQTNPQPGYYGSVRGDLRNAPNAQVHRGVNDESLESGRASLLVKPNEFFSLCKCHVPANRPGRHEQL